jgi:hypothetical protein
MEPGLLFVLQYFDEGIFTYESMTTPNRNTITEYTAAENVKKAAALRKAKELFRQWHNEKFAEGIISGLTGMGRNNG